MLGDGRTPDLPAIRAEQDRRCAALAAAPYVVLRPGLDAAHDAAQRAAAADPRVQAAVSLASGARLLAEVMAVGEARAGDLPNDLAARCPPGACTRVLIYVYPDSTSLTVVVDDRTQVVDVQTLPGAASARNPFGVLGLFYACGLDTLYAGSVLGSLPTQERGGVVAIQLPDGAQTPILRDTDVMGVLVVRQGAGSTLYAGLARRPEVIALPLDAQGHPARGHRPPCST